MKLRRLLSFAVLFFMGFQSFAQYTSTVPLHPEVRFGQLENGMTYYVLHNEEPKERASFYFVQNVGAILEEDAQNGLAHFLEHMAFNGTQNFKGKGIINYMEKYGVKFGRNINAYTSLDETVYNLSGVPVNHSGLLDSCLLVLHDWSGYLSLEEEEIDAERGVIREEWRTRRNVRKRLMDQTSKVNYYGSKYSKRDVIGDLDVINNFKYQTLRDYYKEWYRPDQQAVVVVGDVNVDEMVRKIQEIFSPIPMPKNAAERKYYEIPNHEELLFCVAKDKEADAMSINLMFKKDVELTKGEAYMKENIVKSMYKSMLNSRFQELLRKSDAASVSMGTGFFGLGRLKNASYIGVNPKENQAQKAFEQLMVEMERVNRYGFTSAELNRIKLQFLRSYESYYQEREKINNDEWAKQFQYHFLKGEPAPSVEFEYEFAKKAIPAVTLEDVNSCAKSVMTKNNCVLTVTGPEREDMEYPTKEALLSIMEQVKKMEVAPYEDETGDAPLIAEELSGSKVVKTFQVKNSDAKGMVLVNGARIIILPTEHSKDEVLVNAYSWGGTSLLKEEDLASANAAVDLAQGSGLGEFDAIQLRKKLTGKLAGVSPYLNSYSEGFKGSASAQDLETLLQLIWLNFEKPRFDKDIFKTQMSRRRNQLVNIAADNSKAFKDSITVIGTNHHPRVQLFGEEFLNKMDFEKAKEIYKNRFQNAGDFTFVFVGNIDVEKATPLMEKYIGSLKGNKDNENYTDHGIRPPKGKVENEFEREMETPKASVYFGLSGKVDYSLESRLYVSIIGELLSKRYLETIRESEGGSYGVGVRPSVAKIPYEHFKYKIFFDCDPQKQERLSGIVEEEIQKLINEGPVVSDLEKIKKNLLKNRSEQETSNGFWMGTLENSLMNGESIVNSQEYGEIVNSITAPKIKKFAKKIFKKVDVTKVVMGPKK